MRSVAYQTLELALFTMLLTASGVGCAGRQKLERPPLPRGPEVADLVILGNDGFSDKELRKVITTEESSKILFWKNAYLDVGALSQDRERLRTFYQMHGYLDATVAPLRVVPYTRGRPSVAAQPAPPGAPGAVPDIRAPLPGPQLGLEPGEVPGESLQLAPPVIPPGSVGPAEAPETPMPDQTAPGPEPVGEAGKKRPGRVRVIFRIREGPRYHLRAPRLQLAAPLPPPIIALLQHELTLEPGRPYDLEEQENTARRLEAALRDASYAWAEVKSEAVAIPTEDTVRVRFTVDAGPPTVFGSFQIEGLSAVDPSIILERAARLIISGRPFQPALLLLLQRQLFALQLFQTVLVVPAPASRGQPRADVLIRVREGPFRLVRAGGGFTQDLNWQEVYGNGGWDHNFLARRLMRLSLFAQGGWAFDPAVWSSDAYDKAVIENGEIVEAPAGRNGPIADVRATLTLPDFKARRLDILTSTRFLVGQTLSYGFMSPQLRFNVSRLIAPNLTAQAGLGLEQYLPTPDAASRAVFASEEINHQAGEEIQFKGLLTFLDQNGIYDRRDNILATQRGLYAGLYTQEAGLFGDFAFLKVVPDLRVYIPLIRDRLVLATRLFTGFILPLADKAAPAVLRFQLGGGATVRGFGRDQITVYGAPTSTCTTPSPVPTAECSVATGGNVFYLANLEVRVLFGNLGVVGFVDAGQVKAAPQAVLREWIRLRPSELEVAVGLGLRYRTLIGPARIDLGIRVRDPADLAPSLEFLSDAGCNCAVHLGIGEAF